MSEMTSDRSRTEVTAEEYSQNVIQNVRNNMIELTKLSHEQKPTMAHCLKLLTDVHSSGMTARHVSYIERLMYNIRSRGGVLLSELIQLFKIIEILVNQVGEHDEYILSLQEIVSTLGGAMLKERASDEQRFIQVAVDSVEQIALLLRIPDQNLRKQIIQAILGFWETKPVETDIRRLKNPSSKARNYEFRQCSKEFHQSVIEKSKIVETLVQSMALVTKDSQIRISILKVLEKLMKSSKANSSSFVSAKGPEYVVLSVAEAEKTTLPVVIDILWNAMEYGPQEVVVEQMSKLNSVSSMHGAFAKLMKSSISVNEKQLRNDLLVLFIQLAQSNASAPFVETRFLADIISFGCSNERNLTNSPLDFEFIQMLLTCLVIISADGAALRLIRQSDVVPYLLLPVQKLDEGEIYPTRSLYQWSPAQKEELQLLSLSLLTTLAPRLPDVFIQNNGAHKLMAFLFWSFQTDFSGHGNSILGVGGRGSARAQCRLTLRCIRALCCISGEIIGPYENSEEARSAIIASFVEEGIIDLLLLTLTNVNNLNDGERGEFVYIEDDCIDLEMQEDMLVILSLIAENSETQKELMQKSKLTQILIHYLSDLPGKVVSGLRCEQLLLGVLDCLFNAVYGLDIAEEKFLELEGAFLLIDLLEKVPHQMHQVVLSCLVELSENPRSLQHLLTWRSSKVELGKTPITLPQVLIQLWKAEEERMGCFRGPKGELGHAQYPLAGWHQIQEMKRMGDPSPALADISENVRAKIYCLMTRIGFNELPGIATEDYVTLALIEKYYDLKISEVWDEVISELAIEKVELIDADKEAAETIKQAQLERAKAIQSLQDQLKEAQNQQDRQEEQILFEKIREKYRQAGKITEQWFDFIERTSNYTKLEEAKKEMAKHVDQSRIRHKHHKHTVHHKINLDLNTTTFQGRNIFIESTPSALTRDSEADY